ncbi:hypothetical protein Drorol1_Dr00022230 [Drosera rotundifolia]
MRYPAILPPLNHHTPYPDHCRHSHQHCDRDPRLLPHSDVGAVIPDLTALIQASVPTPVYGTKMELGTVIQRGSGEGGCGGGDGGEI